MFRLIYALMSFGLMFAYLIATLGVCRGVVCIPPSASRQEETGISMPVAADNMVLWTLSQSNNAVQCVASHHPLGVELRYVMNSRLLMSRVFDSWERLSGQAQIWREGLQLRGWVEPAAYGRAHRR